MNYLAFVCLFFGWAEAQERFFFNNPFFTIKKTVISTVTTNVRATCYEIVDVKSCRKKKEAVFFHPYHHDFSGAEMQFLSPGQYRSQQYVPLVPVIWDLPKQVPSPFVESSFDESRREAGSEARSFLKYTTSTELKTVTAKMAGTQTLIVSCVAPGSTIPTPPCNIEATFPPRPASMTLEQYCAVLGEAAKMKVAECREATARKARQTTGAKVIMIFTQKDGGDFPSRSRIASNIVAKLVPNGSSFTLPGLPAGFKFEASAVLISSVNIFAAAGLGSNCPNGDLTCGIAGAGKCVAGGACTCNDGYTLKNNICVGKSCKDASKDCASNEYCESATSLCKTTPRCTENACNGKGSGTGKCLDNGKCDCATGEVTANSPTGKCDAVCTVGEDKTCSGTSPATGKCLSGRCSCTLPNKKSAATGKCVLCLESTDCKENDAAIGTCEADGSCKCTKGIAITSTGKCFACTKKEDCNQGATDCKDGKCVCDAGFKIDEATGKCGKVCTVVNVNKDCAADEYCKPASLICTKTPKCTKGACNGKDSGKGSCNPETGKCDCDVGEVVSNSVDGKCDERCTEDDECEGAEPATGTCSAGKCLCPTFKKSTTTGKCVVCLSDGDCRGTGVGTCNVSTGACSCVEPIRPDTNTGRCNSPP